MSNRKTPTSASFSASRPSGLGKAIRDLDLERYVLELESDGLTVVPPNITGVTVAQLDRCTEVLLARFTAMTGCPISLEKGPEAELAWPAPDPNRASLRPRECATAPTQMLIQQLLQLDRCFRDLAVNPVADALIDHVSGPDPAGGRARRLSSTNAFVKWQGDYGYGPGLGLHVDQGANPLPWGRTALTSNATWALTDYTRQDGALAYVPESHKMISPPTQPLATKMAQPLECPRGSLIVFQGTTWHGAFPKRTPGLRLNAVSYYRHVSVLPQENLKVSMVDQPWQDCDNPKLMRELIGFDDEFPYTTQSQPVAKLARPAVSRQS